MPLCDVRKSGQAIREAKGNAGVTGHVTRIALGRVTGIMHAGWLVGWLVPGYFFDRPPPRLFLLHERLGTPAYTWTMEFNA